MRPCSIHNYCSVTERYGSLKTLCRQTRKKKEKKAFLAGVVAEAIQANTTREILIQTDSTSSSIRNATVACRGRMRGNCTYVLRLSKTCQGVTWPRPALDCRGWFSECEFGADNGGVVLGRDLSFTLLTNTFRRLPPLPPFPSLNDSSRFFSAMGLSVSRLLSGLFGKKEMRASLFTLFLPCHLTCAILTRFLGILMVTLSLLPPPQPFLT